MKWIERRVQKSAERMMAAPPASDFDSVWAYIWNRKRWMAPGVLGAVWSVVWFFFFANSWWWQVAFEVLFVLNVYALGKYIENYYRFREPPSWAFDPDAMIAEFTKDEKDE